jgi:hypothetical protein
MTDNNIKGEYITFADEAQTTVLFKPRYEKATHLRIFQHDISSLLFATPILSRSSIFILDDFILAQKQKTPV